MERDGEDRCRGGCGIASQALRPREPIVCSLGAGLHVLAGGRQVHFRWKGARGQLDGLCARQTHPSTTKLTPRPVPPKDRVNSEVRDTAFDRRQPLRGRGGDRWEGKRLSRNRSTGFNRPKNSTDLPGFARRSSFLTLDTKRAGTTMSDASAVDHADRAVAFRSALLYAQGMACWAA